MSTIKSSSEHLTLNADGASKDIKIQNNGSENVIVKSDGSVGIGTTPESWNSGWKTLQIGDGASIAGRTVAGNVDISSNAYRDLTDNRWEYIGANGSEEAAKYTQFDGTHVFYTAPAGSADSAITFSTKATIDTDGLKFNGDTAAANALSDYEAGTFQPSFVTGSGSITAHASYSLCRYTKIGRMVQIQGLISTSGVSSPSGSMQIHGLPFAVDNNTSGESSGNAALAIAGIVDLDSAINVLTMRPEAGTSYITVEEFNGTGTSDVADKWKTGTYFRFSGTYTT